MSVDTYDFSYNNLTGPIPNSVIFLKMFQFRKILNPTTFLNDQVAPVKSSGIFLTVAMNRPIPLQF
ncbi:hypothetical protein DVH24_041870 [Malus domestica]|uniref:Non-specific serine/threonine protein kinase n=1 Tax=Malus domestica TaxID=3750 RepID=A0A498IT57_MALDO|nr:hypothetical protein DVH24_041870 [Malus domestica]